MTDQIKAMKALRALEKAERLVDHKGVLYHIRTAKGWLRAGLEEDVSLRESVLKIVDSANEKDKHRPPEDRASLDKYFEG